MKFEMLGKLVSVAIFVWLVTRFVAVSVGFSQGPWTRWVLNQAGSAYYQTMDKVGMANTGSSSNGHNP